ERILVAADKDDFFGERIRADRLVHAGGGFFHHRAETRVLGAEGDDVLDRPEHQNFVNVHVGDHRVGRHGGLGSEVVGTEQAGVFSGDDDEKEGSASPGVHSGKGAGDFEQSRTAGGVVQGAVVDRIAFHGFTNADVVEVCGVDDVFILQCGVAAFEFGDDILALRVARLGDAVQGGGYGQCKNRHRLAGPRKGEEFFGAVRGPLK